MKPWLRWSVLSLVVLIVLSVILLNDKTDKSPPSQTPETESGKESVICDTLLESGGAADLQAEAVASAPTTSLPRMLELGSVGCRPCDMMAPIIEELRKEYDGRLSVEFYDVRKDPTPARQYSIRVIPTQIFLDAKGDEFFRHEGYLPKDEILTVLDQMGVSK